MERSKRVQIFRASSYIHAYTLVYVMTIHTPWGLCRNILAGNLGFTLLLTVLTSRKRRAAADSEIAALERSTGKEQRPVGCSIAACMSFFITTVCTYIMIALGRPININSNVIELVVSTTHEKCNEHCNYKVH